MQLKVLGCSGGIGGTNLTSAFLLNDQILIDAGTGVGTLSFEALTQIQHVFLSHAHFDHIACLPMLLDSVIGKPGWKPVHLHASEETLAILREHIFNWRIWPDFNQIPDEAQPILRFCAQAEGVTHSIDSAHITALPAEHTVPAVGFRIDSGQSSLIYSGDSIGGEAFWRAVNQTDNLSKLIIETAFPDRESRLAHSARHLCPHTLLRQLQ